MKFNFMKKKRAISPVVATVLLISLVVAASAIVFTLVVPMLKGSSDISILSTQWFDTDSDSIVDIVYITLQNSGTAEASITGVSITLLNDRNDTSFAIPDIDIEQEIPYIVSISARADLIVYFNATEYIYYGNNIFRVSLTYGDDNIVQASENLRHIDLIEDLSISVINPLNNSWFSGIIDPQVIRTGGFLPDSIHYTLYYPLFHPQDPLVPVPNYANVPITKEIRTVTDGIPDNDSYILTFNVTDFLSTYIEKKLLISIDNTDPAVVLQLNDTLFNPGEGVDIAWTVTGIDESVGDSALESQLLIITGDNYEGGELYSDDGSTATEGVQISPYDLPGADTLLMPENDYTITIYIRDLAGNTKADGVEFSLIDNLKPICYIILPENDSVDISGLMYFEVFAFDSSGINTEFLDLYFYSLTTDYWDVFQLGIDFEANYIGTSNIFTFYFDSVKVPNDYYSIVVVVQDLAASENAQGSEILATIDNELLIISGVLATDGRGGFFRRRGTLVFWLENPGTAKYNITEVEFSWGGNNRITFVYEMVDDTSGHTWLFSPGPYIEDTAYDIDTDGAGVPVIPAELYGGAKHKISMLFDYGDKPTGVTFTISFHIVSDSVDVWVPFTLYL